MADQPVLLLPDYQDVPSEVLVSFPEIKRQTTQALYPGNLNNDNNSKTTATQSPYHAVDKSPKGSVDEPIRPLVDLINHHPSFSTLSSCSGRIALFEPWGGMATTTNNNNNNDEEHPNDNSQPQIQGTPESGKGRGGWLFVSHEIIEASKLHRLFQDGCAKKEEGSLPPSNNNDDSMPSIVEKALVFKVEPMLLHVAAATLDRGKQLLNLALSLGFRESGIVLPNKRNPHRVTVAIRGMSLALTVPLSFDGPLCPSFDYLQALVDQANHRLTLNQGKIDKLYQSVQETLFRERSKNSGQQHRLSLNCNPLADLNLWGHAALAVPVNLKDSSSEESKNDNNVDVLVFGGYGQGPALEEEEESPKQCQRSGEVYCLKRREGVWNRHWERIVQREILDSDATNNETIRIAGDLGVNVLPAPFTKREGAAVISLDTEQSAARASNVVGVWGGRKGPNNPLDELLLYEYPARQQHFWIPTDVRGEKPLPRWGHSLTALKYCDSTRADVKRIALLIGGRNERATIPSVHLLSLIQKDTQSDSAHFMWETITFSPSNLEPPSLPFDHSTIAIQENDGSSVDIFVFGGKNNPVDLLGSFAPASEEPSQKSSPISFSLSLRSDGQPCVANLSTLHIPSTFQDFKFGGAVTLLQVPRYNSNIKDASVQQILMSGGIPELVQGTTTQSSGLQLVELVCQVEETTKQWTLRQSKISFDITESALAIDQTVMVHHRAVAIPSSKNSEKTEILLLGGGVMGFAFGPTFSRSFQVEIGLSSPFEHSIPAEPIADIKNGNPSSASTTPTSTTSSNSKTPPPPPETTTTVVYVQKQNAKGLKTELEKRSWLDKRFRMRSISVDYSSSEDDNGKIAVPVTQECFTQLQSSSPTTQENNDDVEWMRLVEGSGREVMPLSTAQFARKPKKKKQ